MQRFHLRFSMPKMSVFKIGFQTCLSFLSSLIAPLKRGRLTRLLGIGALAVALWVGTVSLHVQPAQAAATSAAEAYKNGPIRQSHNPLSKENYNGGVDPSVVYQHQNQQARQPEDDRTTLEKITDQLQETFSGSSSSEVKPEKNPTLRYLDDERQ